MGYSSIIFALDNYFLCTCCVLGPVLGPGKIVVKIIDKVSVLMSLYFSEEETINK